MPIEREVLKYRKYGRPFFPLRFLNLLPLSHMFGQAMATFIPPMLPGTAIFMRSYNPADIVRQIRTRRVSVLVSVPKILDVLREHVLRTRADDGDAGRAPDVHWARRWWRTATCTALFGLKFWALRRRRRAARRRSSRRSGRASGSSSSRATGSPRPRRSSP